MYCYHCGYELADDSVFCPSCGNRVRTAAAQPQQAESAPEEQVQQEPVQEPVPAEQYVPDMDPTIIYTRKERPTPTETPQPSAPVYEQAPPRVQPQQAAPVYEQAPPRVQPQQAVPVYAQPQSQAQTPVQVYVQTPAQTPVRQHPQVQTPAAVQAQKEASPSRKAGIWPAACGVMGILALVFYLIGAVVMMSGIGSYFGLVSAEVIIVYVLMAVGFFVHTRKIPWVTILPFLIHIIFTIYQSRGVMTDILGYSAVLTSAAYLIQLLGILLQLIMFIFYVLITTIRPRGAGLKVVFIIFMALEITLLLISSAITLIQGAVYMGVSYMAYLALIRMAYMFFYIGYGIAAMSVQPREQ